MYVDTCVYESELHLRCPFRACTCQLLDAAHLIVHYPGAFAGFFCHNQPIVSGVCVCLSSGTVSPASFNRFPLAELDEETVNMLLLGPALIRYCTTDALYAHQQPQDTSVCSLNVLDRTPDRIKRMVMKTEDKGFSKATANRSTA